MLKQLSVFMFLSCLSFSLIVLLRPKNLFNPFPPPFVRMLSYPYAFKSGCSYELKCKCSSLGIMAPENWLDRRTPYGSRELSPQRWEQSQVSASLQVSLSCHCRGLAGGTESPLPFWLASGFHGHFALNDCSLTQPVKPAADLGGISLSSSSGFSNSGDFDSMRTQLNLGGPLWRNNNNDKCTSVASLKSSREKCFIVLACLDTIYSRLLAFAASGRKPHLVIFSPFPLEKPNVILKHCDDSALCTIKPSSCALWSDFTYSLLKVQIICF